MAIRVFRHYVPTSLVVLGAVEFLLLLLAVHAGVSLRLLAGEPIGELLTGPLMPKAVLFASVIMVMMVATGLYQQDLRDGVKGIAARISVSFLFALLAMSLIGYALPSMFLGSEAFAVAFSSAFFGIILSRLLFYTLIDYDSLKTRVLVLGAGSQASQIEQLRRKSDRHGVIVIGYVHMRNDHDVVDPAKVLQVETTLPALVGEYDVDEIVIAVDDRKKNFPVDEIIECKLSGVRVIDLLTFFERQTGKIKLDILHPSSIILLDGFSHAVLRSFSKRAFDVVVSLLMLLAAAPVMLLTALGIVLESKGHGPVFYRQERVGRNGKAFDVVKFRSMRVDAERDGVAKWAHKNDPRVTFVGSFIRKTRIDELPQLINVLRGDMSFVGPRPERPQFVKELSAKIPYYAMRHRVNPGITGWAQIRYPYGASEKDAREKLQFDLYYIKNYSIFLDLTILFQTVQVILWGQGAR